MFRLLSCSLLALAIAAPVSAAEVLIGDAKISPGIVVIFEAAPKDDVYPHASNLAEGATDIHVEARVNWESADVPKGAPESGFIPYLTVKARATNETTGASTEYELLPHINLSDNFHYARNIKLPGDVAKDKYTVVYTILPPAEGVVNYHHDWHGLYGATLFKPATFTFKHQDFAAVAASKRR
jgi:uncharacterized protein involved in high-affinity Fe2+ transport